MYAFVFKKAHFLHVFNDDKDSDDDNHATAAAAADDDDDALPRVLIRQRRLMG